ncbi:amino acid adenylation domain-containing protein [Myxococcus sp. K15C18031901]|uniref:non-ribosomal peptide synthetase n=1 Tax=Myxococcus dinghuensis TaxID=2906761 RepID=UPI0020A7B219|nr:amino acid adenylation domain-containing protein [Myxococcus dinghuensis]MCP3102825.1 amino acid adenylation domain-containing protein [Myxococcus dinghuensis]
MKMGELLAELNRRGLEVWSEGETLKLRGPKGAAGEELRLALAEHKGELLAMLRERQRVSETRPIVATPRTGPAPLSYGQQRLWFLHRLEPRSSAYNLVMPLSVEGGQLDPTLLERCFVELTRRHEILRTRYAEEQGVPVQHVEPEPRLEFATIHEAEVLAFEPGGMEAFLRREGERPFDLTSGPLLRVLVVDRGAQGQFIQVCLHHIAADVWARTLLIRELTTLYSAFSRGEPSPLSPLQLQYADFATWQRAHLQGEVRRELVDAWRRRLEGMPPLLELPADHARPRVQSYAGGEVRFEVPPSATEALKALSHAANATPFMGMLSAFFVLLHRLTGRDDLVVGANSINRGRPELEPLVGFFVDNLVMRVDLGGQPSFDTVIERVREVVLDAFAHQDLPFDLLVEELKPPRTLGYNPLFQAVFSWTREADGHPASPGLRIQPLEFETTTSRFDLNLFVEDRGERLTVRFVFNRDLFARETVQHYVDCFQRLLHALLAEPHRPVTELPVLSSEERERLLRQWNDTQGEGADGPCLHELIEAQAGRTPEASAVVVDDWELTYGEVDQRSDRLAAYLQTLGVGPEVVVGVYLGRSPELVISLLGVLKAGGAFLALDPEEPSERLRRILEDARPKVLLASGAHPERTGMIVVQVEETCSALPDVTGHRLRRSVTPDHLAYILYTSGSTGQPKGTQVTHRSIVNYLRWCVRAYRLHEGVGSPVLGSVSFDGTLTSLFAPLLAGKALFLLPRHQELEVLASRDYLERDFSFIKLTPSHLRAFDGLGRLKEVLDRTRAVVLGGEGLHGADLETWAKSGSGARVVNEYGPTEAAVACCFHELSPDGAPLPARVPIGRPIANTELYVLDRHGQPVPRGVVGELYIGGVGLARGYLGRPALTAERFVPDPFVTGRPGREGSRLYRTGDLARCLADGTLEFLGRVDDQLKIRGHRVETGEVEAALSRHPRVVQAAVALQRAAGREPRLVAWVQPSSPRGAQDSTSLETALRGALQGSLPEYMRPAVYFFVDTLPLTASGKVDRKALPEVSARMKGEVAHAEGDVAGLSVTEGKLQALYGELLGLQTVSPEASFFDLGGHSLLAITLLSRIREQLGVEVPLGEVFERPSVKALARWVEGQSHVPAPRPRLPEGVVALRSNGSNPPLFITPPSAGNPAVYIALTRHLSSEQPVFGFQMPGVMDDTPPPGTVEDTAALYVDLMRRVQPRGPYRVAGWSYGGIIACEMARQLEARGEQVALLGLIDGASLDRKAARDSRDLREAVSTGSQLVKVMVETPLPRDYANLRLVGEWMGISLPESPGELLRTDPGGKRSYLRRLMGDVGRTARNMRVTLRAERTYVFTSYGGTATLFRAEPPKDGRDSLVDSVRRFARGGVRVVVVPGNHMTLIMEDQHVAVLARHLQASLDLALPDSLVPHGPRPLLVAGGGSPQFTKEVA